MSPQGEVHIALKSHMAKSGTAVMTNKRPTA